MSVSVIGRAQRYAPGDLVRVVALPEYCRSWERCGNVALRCHAVTLRHCLGGVYRVANIGENDSLEVEITSDVRWHRVFYVGEDGHPELEIFKTLQRCKPVACTIFIEPECVDLVARRAALPRWSPPVWALP